jgi:hypothetical protein
MAISITVVFNVTIITDVAIFMLQLSAAELPANWAQWWWWRFNGPARIAASFGGALIFCIVVLGPKLLTFLNVPGAQNLVLPWWWQTLLVMGLTTILWVTVALCTKPDPDTLLSDFYKRARPLGAWRPYSIKFKHLTGENKGTPVLRGMLIAVTGFAATCLLINGITELWFGRYKAGVIELIVSALLFILFRKTSRRFLQFLDTRTSNQTDPLNF